MRAPLPHEAGTRCPTATLKIIQNKTNDLNKLEDVVVDEELVVVDEELVVVDEELDVVDEESEAQ